MSTEAQLKALSNSELASGIQIPALNHRTVNNAIIEEMYDAQSRGNVLSGVQSAGSLASGDQVFVIRSGQAYLLDASNLDFVSALSDLTDVSITSLSNDQILVYDTSVSRWVNKFIDEIVIGGTITGTGTVNTIPKFTDLKEIGDSNITDDGTTVGITGNLAVNTNDLFVDASNSRVGIGTATPSTTLQVVGNILADFVATSGNSFTKVFSMDQDIQTTDSVTFASVTANSHVTSGGTSSDFVKGNGSLDSTTYQDTGDKGQANGYTPLDSGAKVAEAYLPDSILGQVSYQGTWDASTNTPTLANPPASTTKGEYYVTSVAGTQFSIDFQVGDWIISNGTSWEKVDNTDAVTSVFGRLGNIVANESDYSSFYPTLTGANTFTNDQTFNGDITLGTGTVFSYLLQSPDLNRYVDMGGSTLDLGAGGADKVRVGASLLEVLTDTTISGDLITDSVTIPNGEFYNSRRSSGNLSLPILGHPSGSDTVRLLSSGGFDFVNGSLTNLVAITNAGNVGIGTSSSPSSKLEVNSGLDNIVAKFISTDAGSWIQFNDNDILGYYLGTTSSSFVIRDTNNAERMRIDSSGNVGIGTSSASAKITLSGTGTGSAIDWVNTTASTGRSYRWVSLNAGGFAIEDLTASGAERLRIDSSGRVGIGTSPATKLDVNGEIRASNGILFGTDTASANALDDYEEGTFIPVLTGSTSGTLSGTGIYTKIGDVVNISIKFIVTTANKPIGNYTITGLPFTSKATNPDFISFNYQFARVTFDSSKVIMVALPASSTTISLSEMQSNNLGTEISDSNFVNAGNMFFRVNGNYFS